MDLSYSEEQGLLRASAERFLAEEYGFAERQKAAQSDLGYSAEIWRQFAALGWLALPLPESAGGLGGGALDLGILMEAFGKALVLEPYFATLALGAAAIIAAGDDAQQAATLPAVAEGRTKLAFAHADAGSPATARREGTNWRLAGRKRSVVWGGAADQLVVSARIGDGIGLFLVPVKTTGIDIEPYPLVDGTRAADVTLSDVTVDSGALLGANESALPAIEAVLDRAIGALAWDAVGALSAVLDSTVEYAKTRVQFGQPIAKFQALQHRMAEMAVLREEARALALLASLKADGVPEGRVRAASAAKVKVGRAARCIAEEAVQMHGGMGVTDELDIGAYLKRILVFDLSLGSVEHHLRRYASLARGLLAEAAQEAGRMDLSLSPAERDFQSMVRAFLDRNLTPEIRRAQEMTTTVFAEYEVALAWQKILHRQGWVAPAWLKEHGGTGWSIAERYIWQIESTRAGAPIVSPIAIAMVGPVLIHFGTAAQKQRFLPRILSGEDYWCQGFSEPGAGSDLASLRTRATADGADYVVNGTKIWTTHAHYANWMIALVRTADTGRRQEGITCLLIDMKTPGLSVRPIMTIGGDHEVNQVFFDDVRVPESCRVGGEGEGWTVAKYLLEFERGGVVASPSLRSGLAQAVCLAKDRDDPHIRARIAEIAIDIDALEMLELQTSWAMRTGRSPGAMSSILKLRASQLQQAVSGLAVEVLGEAALRWDPRRPLYDAAPGNADADSVRPVMSRYLNNRANTIFGGSSEIQKTIIAKEILGI